jgi:glycosyltransferase involved in cell wall biosynthesis
MTKLVSFRPGVAKSKSAFEAMAEIYRYLERIHGYQITIICSEDDSFDDDQLEIQRIPDKAWQPTVPKLPIYPHRLSYRRHVDPIIEEADIVLTVDPTAYQQGALGIRRANKLKKPVWVDTSATINGDFELLQLIKKPIEYGLLQKTDRILATVPKTVERFRDRQLYDETTADAFEVLGHPVDTKKFSPKDNTTNNAETNILAVTRLVPEKGLSYIVEAVAPILQDKSDTSLHILGQGPMQAQLERRACQLGVRDNIEFLGTVPHNEVPAVLNKADIFVNHAVANSHWEEFFGVANLEAMSCGLPTVVSDCGGIPFVIRERDIAEIVPQRSIVDIRTAIQQLIDNPEIRKEMGENARSYVREHYSIKQIANRYHSLVEKTLESTV